MINRIHHRLANLTQHTQRDHRLSFDRDLAGCQLVRGVTQSSQLLPQVVWLERMLLGLLGHMGVFELDRVVLFAKTFPRFDPRHAQRNRLACCDGS